MTDKQPWTPRNGWGVQIWKTSSKGGRWVHVTVRAQRYTRKMAQCFADGLNAAGETRPYRLVDTKGNQVKKWGPAVEDGAS